MAAAHETSTPESAETGGRSIASKFGPFGAKRGANGRFTTLQVWLKVAVIVLYIVIATVWFPSWLMKPNSLAVIRDLYAGLMPGDLWNTVLSLIVSGVWFVALAFGLVALREAQKHRLI
jgi:amino acid transporter